MRGQTLFEHAQPALQIAELDERPSDERRRPVQLLRDAVRVADDGQLLVGALDFARRAPGKVHEHLEEQGEGPRLRVIERPAAATASWTIASPVSGNPRSVVVRESSQRQKIPGSMPVCHTRAP